MGEIDPGGKVTNSVGSVIGFIDESRMALLDIHNNVFMTISENGRIENGQSIVVGTSKPFRPFLFRVISAYLWFFDPALANNGHFSLVTSEKGKGLFNIFQQLISLRIFGRGFFRTVHLAFSPGVQ